MIYAIQHLAEILHAQLLAGSNQSEISDLLIDSRSLAANQYSLFFAIKTDRNDGHRYIADAHKKGVRNFVVENHFAPNSALEANYLIVENSLHALQQLAQYHRNRFHFDVVGITGSNGKTTVKEWLNEISHETFNTVRSPKSYNSQVGVPLSLWLMEAQHNLGIFEAGISVKNEMKTLAKLIAPRFGIFTNIGHAHDEGFENEQEKIEEKLHLFDSCDWFLYRADYPTLHHKIQTSKEYSSKAVFWSNQAIENSIQVSFSTISTGTSIKISGLMPWTKNIASFEFDVRFTDKASLENAVHTCLVALKLGVSPEALVLKMNQLGNLPMRLELKEGVNGCLLINDTYNSDLDSLQIALDFLAQQKKLHKRSIILSDILQSGKTSQILYKQVAEHLHQYGISKVIAIGKDITKNIAVFENFDIKTFNHLSDFLKAYQNNWFSNEVVLIKGARSFQFEKISALLEQKVHGTVMEINLSAMLNNLNFYRNRFPKGVKIMAMVKAFSYGSGSFEVAQLLQYHRVDYLAVAYADEGVELRNGGITLPIMVMNADEAAFETLIRFQLEPEIYSIDHLRQFIVAIQHLEISPEKVIPIHLKLETGMHRLGFETEELEEMCTMIKSCEYLKVASVFSHLVAADSVEHDDFTHHQARIFEANANYIAATLGYTFLKHLVNTAGQFRFPEYGFDMVRLGIGLYGIGSTQEEKQQLDTVCALYTTVSQVKNLKTGDSVGYNRRFIANKNSQSATLAIGYADGFSRKLSNGIGKVFYKGKMLPIIGNVCMDMCMVEAENTPLQVGDKVEIFGKNISVYEIAQKLETIPYEVLTSISRRVKRIYFQE